MIKKKYKYIPYLIKHKGECYFEFECNYCPMRDRINERLDGGCTREVAYQEAVQMFLELDGTKEELVELLI